MRGIQVTAASAAIIVLGGVPGSPGKAQAADLNTKAPALQTPAGPATCTSIVGFFTTDCLLAAYGVRFYGTIDIGYGYQSNGAPLNKFTSTGETYFPQKLNNGAKWQFAQNALSQSNFGFQVKEPLGAGWSFIGQVEGAFDPASFNLVSGPGSLRDVIGQNFGSAQGASDSSTNGQFWNSLGYVGVSHDTWGTLTFLRQKDLLSDAFGSFDPIGGSYAYSLVNAVGTYGGGGDTQTLRGTTAVKYRVNFANYHLGLYGQFGDYSDGNGTKGTFQGELGADFNVGPGVLSLDAIGGYAKDAISEGLVVSKATLPSGAGNPAGTITGLSATVSDNTVAAALAKYTLDRLAVYAGYEWIQYAPPSDLTTGFTDTAGIPFGAGTSFTINNTAYNAGDKVLNVGWFGGRYSITSSLDVSAGYYHVDQAAYGAKTGASSAGTQNVVSGLIDWRFAPKWDTYVGISYDKLNGGLAAGYIADSFLVTTAGIRFRW